MTTAEIALDNVVAPMAEADVRRFLLQVPSETSLGERYFLFDLFRDRWDGQGRIVEIGPFLGGTTRAMAWGMSLNPRLSADSALHTFDRFASYYSAEELRKTIDPMVQDGIFGAAQADELCRGADFERLFHAIHAPHAYGARIHLHNSPMPDLPGEIAGSTALDCLATETALGGVFIDGCKSWAATQYAMDFLLPRTRVGAPVIFQDFGWYTCFWISSFAYVLRDALVLETNVDSTYSFRLTRAVAAGEISQRFARTPDEMGEKFFAEAAAFLEASCRQRADLRGELIAKLHHIAALVSIGRKRQAAALLQRLDVRRYAAFANLIRGCIKSPTYRPGNIPILWKDA